MAASTSDPSAADACWIWVNGAMSKAATSKPAKSGRSGEPWGSLIDKLLPLLARPGAQARKDHLLACPSYHSDKPCKKFHNSGTAPDPTGRDSPAGPGRRVPSGSAT